LLPDFNFLRAAADQTGQFCPLAVLHGFGYATGITTQPHQGYPKGLVRKRSRKPGKQAFTGEGKSCRCKSESSKKFSAVIHLENILNYRTFLTADAFSGFQSV